MPPILTATQQSTLNAVQSHFLEQIPVEKISAQVAEQSGHDRKEISDLLKTFSNESRVTLDLVINDLDPEKRMLEVGAGLCLTSLFLKQEGFNIVALEPALGGFGLFEEVKQVILNHYSHLHLEVIPEPAQQLNSEKFGEFNLIFSNYVMEHIPEWQSALLAMASILLPDGKMVHSAPNYTIPYEPHYGIPVFRHFPDLSKRLFLAADSDPEIWNSLNFITCREIQNFCNSQGLVCNFRKELLYLAFKRINDDPLFRQRHQGLVSNIASFIIQTGLGGFLKYIPPALATPIIMEISISQPKEN